MKYNTNEFLVFWSCSVLVYLPAIGFAKVPQGSAGFLTDLPCSNVPVDVLAQAACFAAQRCHDIEQCYLSLTWKVTVLNNLHQVRWVHMATRGTSVHGAGHGGSATSTERRGSRISTESDSSVIAVSIRVIRVHSSALWMMDTLLQMCRWWCGMTFWSSLEQALEFTVLPLSVSIV